VITIKNRRKKIIQSIQNSPTPVVLHIRRRRIRSSIEKSFSERNVNSLLDATAIQELEQGEIDDKSIGPWNSAVSESPHFLPRRSMPPLKPSPLPSHHMQSPSEPHPLSVALARRKLIRPGDDQWRITKRLQQFTERTRQYESTNSLRITLAERGGLERGSLIPHFDPNDLPPDMAALMAFPKDEVTGHGNELQEREDDANIHGEENNSDDGKNEQDLVQDDEQIESRSNLAMDICTPSTPPLSLDSPLIPLEYLQAFYGYQQAQEMQSKSNFANLSDMGDHFPTRPRFLPQQSPEGLRDSSYFWNGRRTTDDMAWIPLHGIRKALSARIVNSFVESAGSDTNGNTQKKISHCVHSMGIRSRIRA